MGNVEKMIEDGFQILDSQDFMENIDIYSLKLALQAYFSTYDAVRFQLFRVDGISDDGTGLLERSHNTPYIESYFEAILHFHHFIELALKEILRDKHPFLVLKGDIGKDLYKAILEGEKIDEQAGEIYLTIEFSETLKRFCGLVEKNILDKEKYGFIISNRDFLKELNRLRNRITHRGSFILKYQSLDKLFMSYIIKLIMQITRNYPISVNADKLWKYPELSCGIDPIDELLKEADSPDYTSPKIAFLKELARASFNNPIPKLRPWDHSSNRLKERSERIAIQESKASGCDLYCDPCIVCGLKSLVIYQWDKDYKDNNGVGVDWGNWEAKCFCCGFHITEEVGNPNKLGYDLRDFHVSIR